MLHVGLDNSWHCCHLNPTLKTGATLRQIMVDFDQAQYNELEKALGADMMKLQHALVDIC